MMDTLKRDIASRRKEATTAAAADIAESKLRQRDAYLDDMLSMTRTLSPA